MDLAIQSHQVCTTEVVAHDHAESPLRQSMKHLISDSCLESWMERVCAECIIQKLFEMFDRILNLEKSQGCIKLKETTWGHTFIIT